MRVKRLLSACIVALSILSWSLRAHADGMKQYEQALELYRAGEYEASIEILQFALMSGDLNERFTLGAYAVIGDCYRWTNQIEKAKKALETALSLNPSGKNELYILGQFYLDLREYESAISYFDRALDIDGVFRTIPAYVKRAHANAALGRYQEAEADIERALNYNEGYPPAAEWYGFYLLRGNYRESLGQYQEAMSDYNYAIKLQYDSGFPNFPPYLHRYKARLLAASPIDDMRDGKEALRLIELTIDQDPRWEIDLSILAAAYAELGNYEKASETQLRSISMLEKYDWDEDVVDRQARLFLYRSGQPYRLTGNQTYAPRP